MTNSDPTHLIQHWGNGKVQYQQWTSPVCGWDYHMIGSPARIWYHKDGSVQMEAWHFYGEETEDYSEWLIENNITAPYSEEDEMAIKLRWT